MPLVAWWVVPVVCLCYALTAWLVQMYRVVPPRDWLRERIAFIKAQTSAEWNIGIDVAEDLRSIEERVSRNFFFVQVPAVQAGWRNVHGLEDEHVLKVPPEQVDARLQTVCGHLKAIPGRESACFIKRIHDALKPHPATDRRHEKAALLREVEIFRHNYNDTNYENLANLLGKAVWLSCVSLALVVGLNAVFVGREGYFLFGAAGGLISRLTRVLRRRPKASDYGAEWSTLILSPAAGALLGWLGVAVALVLANRPFEVLGADFKTLWNSPPPPLGLLVALLCGFSERLLDRLLGAAQGKVGAALPAEDTATHAKDEAVAGPVAV